jgi:uncharacterized protein with HEPN domain
MIDAGEIAVSCVSKRPREVLANDPILRLALVKAIEIVGEAARKMSAEGRAELADVPGAAIIGMRHRLVHGYMDIDDDILWRTAAERLPPLLDRLRTVPGLPNP